MISQPLVANCVMQLLSIRLASFNFKIIKTSLRITCVINKTRVFQQDIYGKDVEIKQIQILDNFMTLSRTTSF